jgi:hypothetical protein
MSLYSTKLDQLYRFIAGKNILFRNLCRFIKGIHKLGPILSLHRCRKIFVWIFSIVSSVTKILANKIESLYSIFFSKIVYLYRFKRYIFEYRCPPLLGSPSSYMTLQLLHSEFPYIWGKFDFLFYQCILLLGCVWAYGFGDTRTQDISVFNLAPSDQPCKVLVLV